MTPDQEQSGQSEQGPEQEPGSEQEHGHGHGSAHGPAPLTGVDVREAHAVVDELTAVLHAYVDTAVGVRAEFGASESDEDPRILALEERVANLNAELYESLHTLLGMHPSLTDMWTSGDADDADDAEPVVGADEEHERFGLDFIVVRPAGRTDLSLDDVLGVVDDAGSQIVDDLIERGFLVPEWGASKGEDDEEDLL